MKNRRMKFGIFDKIIEKVNNNIKIYIIGK